MRDGLITQPDSGAAPVAFAANRNTIDRLPGDVVSLKVTHPAITEAGDSLPPVARVRMISEVR
ncbi:hypothetical protein D3C84_1073660 [compost metagenome]